MKYSHLGFCILHGIQGLLLLMLLQPNNAAQGVPAYGFAQASSLAHPAPAAGPWQCGPHQDVPRTLSMRFQALGNAVVAPMVSALGIPVPAPPPQSLVPPTEPALGSAAVTGQGPVLVGAATASAHVPPLRASAPPVSKRAAAKAARLRDINTDTQELKRVVEAKVLTLADIRQNYRKVTVLTLCLYCLETWFLGPTQCEEARTQPDGVLRVRLWGRLMGEGSHPV